MLDANGKPIYKKGYRPLLTAKQSEAAINNLFGGAAIVIDSRWAIEESEEQELAKCLYGVLELFPVKLEDNPLILQRAMAIFAMLMALFAVFSSENRLVETLKGNNNGIIGRTPKKEITGTTGNENSDTIADLS